MPPSTAPPSPTVTCSTRTSPLIVPSTWISPPPEMSPSSTMSPPIIDEPFGGRGAGRAGSGVGAAMVGAGDGAAVGCGVGVAPGVAGVVGCGVLEFGLLNIVTGLYEAEGVFGAAVNPHFVVQVRAG